VAVEGGDDGMLESLYRIPTSRETNSNLLLKLVVFVNARVILASRTSNDVLQQPQQADEEQSQQQEQPNNEQSDG
jgi:hypothetical protein